jgi:hypothetical protein
MRRRPEGDLTADLVSANEVSMTSAYGVLSLMKTISRRVKRSRGCVVENNPPDLLTLL